MADYCVYRIYGDEDQLLYIGCSQSVLNRLGGHTQKSWAKDVVKIEIDRYENKIDAELEERSAIENENPKYNLIHNGFVSGREAAYAALKERNEAARQYTKEKISQFIVGKDIRRLAKESHFTESEIIKYSNGEAAPRDYRALALHKMTGGLFNMRDIYPRSYLIKDLEKEGL